MSETDLELLARYSSQKAEDAFAEIVHRHLDLVYCAALRQVRSPQLAEEVAQSVFLKLARHARELAPGTVIGAWLYQVTRREAIDVVRREARRQLREQIACEMNDMNATSADWTTIEPLLDEAMHALDETDRTAILLRFFQNKSLREVGQTLGTSDDAAQKRVSRAVERLRGFFAKRGVAVGTSGLAIVISANAVQAAPSGLAVTISSSAALAGTAVQTSNVIAATKTIAMTTLQKTLIAATLVATGTGIYEAREASNLRSRIKTVDQQQADQIQQLQQERDEALGKLTAARKEIFQLRQDLGGVLKLRAEVRRLRSGQQATPSKPGNAGDPVESAALTWVNRVARLKQRLEQVPGARIPEVQLLDEEDWLAVVKGRPLDTDVDYRRALSALRSAGEGKLVSLMQNAVRRFQGGNNQKFPTDLAELQSYFDPPIDPAILDRWQITPRETVPNVDVGEVIITQKAPAIDEVFDTRRVIGSGGGQGGADFLSPETLAAMRPVYEAYQAAHNGHMHTDFAELQPYVRTPEQQAALQKLILRSSGSK